MNISVTDLVASDFKDKRLIQVLNLFLNDYCRNVFVGQDFAGRVDCDARVYKLCKTLGFLNSKDHWRGGVFDASTLCVLFTNPDFKGLKSEFETWQFDNRQTNLDELSCR